MLNDDVPCGSLCNVWYCNVKTCWCSLVKLWLCQQKIYVIGIRYLISGIENKWVGPGTRYLTGIRQQVSDTRRKWIVKPGASLASASSPPCRSPPGQTKLLAIMFNRVPNFYFCPVLVAFVVQSEIFLVCAILHHKMCLLFTTIVQSMSISII